MHKILKRADMDTVICKDKVIDPQSKFKDWKIWEKFITTAPGKFMSPA